MATADAPLFDARCGHPERPICARGMCRPCYMADWHQRRKAEGKRPTTSGTQMLTEYNTEYRREWRRRNPEKAQAAKARRKAVEGEITAEQWAAILDAYDHRCAYCGIDGQMTLEHVVPLSRGGSSDPSNIVPACSPCNTSKGAKMLDEWLATA